MDLKQKRLLIGVSQSALSEISGIAQHRLSAFELNKKIPTNEEKKCILSSLENPELVSKVKNRKKRVVKNVQNFIPPKKRSYVKSAANDDYLDEIQSLFKKHKNNNKKFSGLSFFSGCGGFSLGASAAGIKIEGFCEIDDGIQKIYKSNFKNVKSLTSDISKITEKELECFGRNNIDIFIGGPPCQGFSLSGKRDVNDPRNRLFEDYLKIVNTVKPKIVFLENVSLLLTMRDGEGNLVKESIVKAFEDSGYSCDFYVVNAAEYGVPQNRRRVFFVGVDKDLKKGFEFPETDYGDQDLFNSKKPLRSFQDACSDLPFIESGQNSDIDFHFSVNHPKHVCEWLFDVKQGKSAHDNKDPKMRPPSGYNTTYKRQFWKKPSSTIQTTFGMISGSNNVHPICTRALTIREAARLQSFPDEFKFSKKIGVTRTAIGNAVPPLLAYKIIKKVLIQIL